MPLSNSEDMWYKETQILETDINKCCMLLFQQSILPESNKMMEMKFNAQQSATA